MNNTKQEVKVNKDLDTVWDGIQNEYHQYCKKLVGKLLTIIDAVIVNNKQNKSVKDLITTAVWEDTDLIERNIADWLNWFQENNVITSADNESNVPMLYAGPPMPSLANFTKR